MLAILSGKGILVLVGSCSTVAMVLGLHHAVRSIDAGRDTRSSIQTGMPIAVATVFRGCLTQGSTEALRALAKHVVFGFIEGPTMISTGVAAGSNKADTTILTVEGTFGD